MSYNKQYLYDNVSNKTYVINKDTCETYKVEKCNRMKININNIYNPYAPIKQLLPNIPSFDITNPNRQSINEEYLKTVNNYKIQDLSKLSPSVIQKMRAYRNYLNSIKLSKKCNEYNKNKLKNKFFVNKVNYQMMYEKIKNTNTYKVYKYINGIYKLCNCINVPDNMTIKTYLNSKQKVLTKKTIHSYNGNIPIYNHYEYCNGYWNLVKIDT